MNNRLHSCIVPHTGVDEGVVWCHKNLPYMNWYVKYAGGVMGDATYCFEFTGIEDFTEFVLRFG